MERSSFEYVCFRELPVELQVFELRPNSLHIERLLSNLQSRDTHRIKTLMMRKTKRSAHSNTIFCFLCRTTTTEDKSVIDSFFNVRV